MAEGRRERVREKVRRTKFDGMPPHEILEFLLYPYLPRKDTGKLAREVLMRMGSLENVFNATEQELLDIVGMPYQAALSLSVLFEIPKICGKLMAKRGEGNFSNADIAGKFCFTQLSSATVEKLLIICLNEYFGFIDCKIISKGDAVSTPLDISDICRYAVEQKSTSIIVSHNHPHADLNPSKQDITGTKELEAQLKSIGISLNDHIIVNSSGWKSLRMTSDI